jgi:hypothetical protein
MRWVYPFLVGLLFGVVQTGYFLQLSFTLASTYGTFLLVTLAWLLGSIIGLRASRISVLSLHTGPWICFVPYIGTHFLLSAFPFQSNVWPLYGVLILTSGTFSGVFFARLGEVVRPVRKLFFTENNGFLLGIVACTIAYLVIGRVVLWLFPGILAALCWVWTPALSQPTVTVEAQPVEKNVELPAAAPDR